jgi:outer membrane receptor protein involved in Fe transport
MHRTLPRRSLIAAAVIALTNGANAYAQTAVPEQAGDVVKAADKTPDAVVATADAQPQVASENVVTVSGTRLGARGYTSPTPVTVFGKDMREARGSTNIGDLIAELPAFRSSVSATQSQRNFGTGVSSSDLRGLGATRTLVLVDGQRFTPTATNGTFDLSMIPTELVERIDVVTGGASAAYGSDAVAGVVNIVLKKHVDGVQGTVQYGESQQRDSRRPLVSLAAGTSFAEGKGNVMLGVEAAQSSGVGTLATREWGRALPGLIAYGANRAAGLPAQAFLTGITYAAQTAGGLVTSGPLKGTAFGPGGAPYNFQYGTVYSNLMQGGSNPGANPFYNWPIETPTKRASVLGRTSYIINDDLEAYVEANYAKTRSDGFTSFNQSAFTIGVDNPFLPADTKAAMLANKLSTISVGRLLTELGGLRQTATHETVRLLAGLKGTLGPDWHWDVNAQQGHTDNQTTIYKNTITANYKAAVYAVAGPSGSPVCGPVASNPNLTAAQRLTVSPGCVPINIFGLGSPSAAALDYIAADSWSKSRYDRSEVTATVRGPLGATWAGPIDAAAGLERRKDQLAVTVSDLAQAAAFSSGNANSYGGDTTVNEGFAELGIPLAKNMTLAKSLDLNAAVRHTDYSISGKVNTWKLGLTYEPMSTLKFRGTKSRDIRAPALTELYAVTGSGVSVASALNPINGQTGALYTSTAGNLALKPERADTTTVGVVVQPDWTWAKGFRASVDGYQIKVNDVITTPSGLDVIKRCFAGVTSYCQAITFDKSSFGIANVAVGAQNQAQLLLKGVDIDVSYDVPLQALFANAPGRLQLRALGSHVSKLVQTDASGSIDRAGALMGGVPSWTWNVNANYAQGAFAANLNARFVSSSKFDATLQDTDFAAANSIANNTFPSATYFNISMTYNLINTKSRRFQLFGGIDNLFDKQPPEFAAIGLVNGNPYDVIGRVYRVGLRFNY